MCGIVGIVEQARNTSSISVPVLQKMTDVISHRGPDDMGHWISDDNRCGFGFRRLSIIDLSPAGHQPMQTQDGRYSIVFNGEVYNHTILRADLEKKGYVYHSRTDTETILNGYTEYGADFFHKMNGMWAVAIWDKNKRELFCARDRVGVKPFYYYYVDGTFLFGSEIKSILEHPKYQRSVNLKETVNYLCYSASSETSTMFEGIHKLQAGHFLRIDSNGNLTTERYWSSLRESIVMTDESETEIMDSIMGILRTAVKDRMISDVPFGVFLSGGIDSSVNVALMAELMDRPVDTFTVGFKDLQKYNELDYARKVSKHFSTNHHEVLIDDTDALPLLETMAWHEDEPNGDPVCIPLYFLSKLTRESGTTVIQVGEGSDEQFVGYPWMIREANFAKIYRAPFMKLPRMIRNTIFKASLSTLVNQGKFLQLEYLRRATVEDESYWGGAVSITPTHLINLLGSSHQDLALYPSLLTNRIHTEARRRSPSGGFYQHAEFWELTHRLPELLLMRVDKMTMAHSLEARVPFLDYRLIEYTMTIPDSMKQKGGTDTKMLLKKAAEKILPAEIIYRKKQGFAAPVNEWLANQWQSYARHEILSSWFVKEGLIRKEEVLRYFSLLTSKKNPKIAKEIFTLLNLSLWHKVYFQ